MTHTPEPVVSGVPYPVTDVGGRPADDLTDFVGTVEFRIERNGSVYVVDGEGRQREDSVRVHEKSGKGGKDVRVWRITRGPDGGFVAETSL